MRGQDVLSPAQVRGSDQFEHQIHSIDGGHLVGGDGLVRAEQAKLSVMLVGARHRRHVGAQGVRYLDRGRSNPAVRPRDEEALAGFEMALGDESVVRRGEGFREAARLGPADVVGDEDEMFGRHQAVGGLSTTANDRTDPSTQQRFADPIADRANDAGHFKPWNIGGPSRRGGVEALTLEKVGGVDTRRVHVDHHVVGTGLGRRAFLNLQISVGNHDCLHAKEPTATSCADAPIGCGNDNFRYSSPHP